MFQVIIPPQRAAKGLLTRRNVQEPKLPNAPNVQPQGTTINDEFHEVISMLCQEVINHVRQQRGDQQEEVET